MSEALCVTAPAKSFCIPRKAVKALLHAKADVHTIAAYLILACFTDASGCYTTAASSAIRRYLQSNRRRCLKAIERLLGLTVRHQGQHVPLLVNRHDWLSIPGSAVPDGPVKRARVQYILHPFDEEPMDRVWIGSGLVEGINEWLPLRTLKQCGNLAARLLLLGYLHLDMMRYGAICPQRYFYRQYSTVSQWKNRHWFVIQASRKSTIGTPTAYQKLKVEDGHVPRRKVCRALEAVVNQGLLEEVVTVLSGTLRNHVPASDAELLYILDGGEPSLAAITAQTADEMGKRLQRNAYAVIGRSPPRSRWQACSVPVSWSRIVPTLRSRKRMPVLQPLIRVLSE